MTALAQRIAWCATALVLISALLVLDRSRFGPATPLSRCNLALSRSVEDAANVLVVGSSRTGTAIDPVALQNLLGAEPGLDEPTVERIALGRSPLRANVALLENYLAGRGDPDVILFEISFLTERSIDRIDDLGSGVSAESFLFRRDVNLMRYHQILSMPAVAMPHTETETNLNRLRYGLRGVTLRSGALAYQLARQPTVGSSLDPCHPETWTREPTWPAGFAFSWDDASRTGRPVERIESLRIDIANDTGRTLQDWQIGLPTDEVYPYDVDDGYRSGELALLDRAVGLAAARDVPIVLLALPVYGTRPSLADLAFLADRFDSQAEVFDLYAAAGVDLSTFWYDDAHLEVRTSGELMTALMAQHLVDGALSAVEPGRPADGSSRHLAARSSE